MKNKLLLAIFHSVPARHKLAILLAGGFCVLNLQSAQSANYYWVNNSGNWSDFANHWATTSGGSVFHTQIPTSLDNVYFDANSFPMIFLWPVVTIDTTIAYCRDMDWTGSPYHPALEAATFALTIFGSLTVTSNVSINNGQLIFASNSPGNTIQTFHKMLMCSIEFNGVGGEWTLLDSLRTASTITLTYGTLRTNDFNIRCNAFNSINNNPRAFYLGTSTVFLTTSWGWGWNVSGSLQIDADSSIIRLRDGGGFYAQGHTYNIVQWDSVYTSGNPWNNVLGGNNLVINKVISLNPSANANLQFNNAANFHVDSIFSRGNIGVNYGTLNHINYIWANRDIGIGYGSANHFNYIWANQAAAFGSEDLDSIITMVVGNDLTFDNQNGNHFIHDLIVGGDLTIWNSSALSYRNSHTFDMCSVSGNASILTGSNHLGVFTMTPGKTLTLKNDSTQYIDSLIATGTPGFPIQILSSNFGLAANVVIQKDFCADYLYIHAVHATSPGSLYAGAHSNNVANNSGWIFANCVVGIEEDYMNALSVYPNPATLELKIKNEKLKIEKVEIYDALGQNVFSQQPGASSQQLFVNVSELNPGIYFLKIKNIHQEQIAKFVKQ